MQMNLSIAVNHKYVKYAYVMLTSLFLNHKKQAITVYVLQTDLQLQDKVCLEALAEQWKQRLVFLQVDGAADALKKLPTTANWSMEMYYRLLLGELLPPEIKRVLYLDVDIIVNQPIGELYETELEGMELGVADDPMIQGNFSADQKALFRDFPQPVRYFNSGVILYDLEKVRSRYSLADYCKVAERFSYRLTNPDQDLLNYVHAGKVRYIDNTRYNVFSQLEALGHADGYQELKDKGAVIHFAGRKPWSFTGVHYEGEKIWWSYAKQTPYYLELMEPVFWNGLCDDSYQTMMALLRENAELKQKLEEALGLCRKLSGMIKGG